MDDQQRPASAKVCIRVCDSSALTTGGHGVRFELPGGEVAPLSAFAVRHGEGVSAFLNQCAHVPVELDWQPGVFFDDEGLLLICATHGATYRPSDGRCVGGPCRGRSLVAVPCFESEGAVYVEWPQSRAAFS